MKKKKPSGDGIARGETKNVIDLEGFIRRRKAQRRKLVAEQRQAKFDEESIALDPSVHDGIEIVKKMTSDQQRALTSFFAGWLETELAVSLGLIEDDEVKETPLFDLVEKVYREASGGCYFCDHQIDPNAIGITSKTPLCAMCKLKLANFITAMGEDPSRYMAGIFGPRRVQKARFKKH